MIPDDTCLIPFESDIRKIKIRKGEKKMDDNVLDVKQVAEYLHCSASTIRKLIRTNEIPYYRVAYRIFFNKQIIDNWIENQCRENIKEAF